jgi:hypothetical protein
MTSQQQCGWRSAAIILYCGLAAWFILTGQDVFAEVCIALSFAAVCIALIISSLVLIIAGRP